MIPSDKKLIADYLRGDEESLELLIRRYVKPIYSFVYRYARNNQEAEDITQDTFIKIWKNFKKFKRQKSFKTWIFTIAKNTTIDFAKKKKTIPFDQESPLFKTLDDPRPLADKISEKNDLIRAMQSIIKRLMPKYQLVLSLRYDENLKFREIAERLKESINTVKSRHRRGLNMLRKNLKEF